MSETKKMANDYKEEMQDLLNKTEKLRLVVITRLYSLCAGFPETPITDLGDTIIKAKSLIPQNRSKDYIKDLSFNSQIHFIEVIETWLAEQSPVKQGKLFN